MSQTVIKNTGKDPVEIKIEKNGSIERTIINRGKIELPVGAKLVSEHPNIKVVDAGNKPQKTEQLTLNKKSENKTQSTSSGSNSNDKK